MSVFYVHLACYVTKETPQAGFSAREAIPVRVEADNPEDAKRKVGEMLSEAIAMNEAMADVLKAYNKTAQQGDSDVR